MKMKQLIAGAVITGGLGAAVLGLGAGMAYADPPKPRPGPVIVQPPHPDFLGRTATPTTAPAGTTGRSNTKVNG